MKAVSKFFHKISAALMETNSTNWSLTKLVMLFLMYPTITGVFIFDAWVNKRMDSINSLVYITAVATPRALSQVLAARYGFKSREGSGITDGNFVDASPVKKSRPALPDPESDTPRP
jgi:hypothetical protein